MGLEQEDQRQIASFCCWQRCGKQEGKNTKYQWPSVISKKRMTQWTGKFYMMCLRIRGLEEKFWILYYQCIIMIEYRFTLGMRYQAPYGLLEVSSKGAVCLPCCSPCICRDWGLGCSRLNWVLKWVEPLCPVCSSRTI